MVSARAKHIKAQLVVVCLSAAAAAISSPVHAGPARVTAEARLVEVVHLMQAAHHRPALLKAQALVNDFPNFQLAQLVYGDLLNAHTRPITQLGEIPSGQQLVHKVKLAQLRQEARQRMAASSDAPDSQWVPSQLVLASSANRHVIAVDASRSRLYLLERAAGGMRRVADFYVSVGKAGIGKLSEGDNKTPTGVYFVTSYLDPAKLEDLYGSGALPINYPNQLDRLRGKTGSGIWLHGKPSAEFARAPLATEGCVAMSNPDMERVIATVAIGSTPVIIAPSLQWVPPQAVAKQREAFRAVLNSWVTAKSASNFQHYQDFYLSPNTTELKRAHKQQAGRRLSITDLSLLMWKDEAETMITTFSEVTSSPEKKGKRLVRTTRQYWTRQGNQWRIFSETKLS